MASPGYIPAFRSAPPGEALDSVITVETPEGIEFTLFPAGPLVRGCSWGIDQFIQWVLIGLINGIASFFEGDTGSWMLLLVIFCVDWFYHMLWEIFGRGQSPGKRLLGIRVVRGDGSPVNPGASFLRNLLRFADTFLFLCPIALVTMLISRGYRRLGDWAAGTLVAYTSQSLSVSALPAPAVLPKHGGEAPASNAAGRGFPGAGGAAALGGEEKQGILMFARRYALLGRARADEIAAPYVRALRGDEDLQDAESPGAAADYLLDISRRLAGE
jgi:uncharacterized RDD family membrane protein YckC